MYLLDAAWSIAGWKDRRNAALQPLAAALGEDIGKFNSSVDWIAVPTSRYLYSPPLTYYFEPAFAEYYGFLKTRYGSNLALLVADLKNCGQDVWKGVGYAEGLAYEVHDTNLGAMDEFQRVKQHLNPWYLRLVEQAFDSLLTLPAYRLQTDAGKQLTLTPWSIYEAIKKHSWNAAGSFYDAIMRNGIGHDVEFAQQSSSLGLNVVYTDKNGNSIELSTLEVQGNVEGLLDECLGYCFALRLFIYENRHSPDWASPLKLIQC